MSRAAPVVLAIDDSQDLLIALRTVICETLPGAAVFVALDGTEGLALAQAEDPDVILLDVVLPGMDGYGVCRRLKADLATSRIPVVFMTALGSDRESRVRALEAGGEGFLTKPLDTLELLAQSRAMAKIKEANDRLQHEQARLAELVAERTAALLRESEERVRAEEEKRVSLEKYRVLFESFPLGVTITDGSGQIIEANRMSELLLGISRDEQASRKLDGVEWRVVRPDGSPMPTDEYASVRALREGRVVSSVEMGIVKERGEVTWINVTAAPIPLDGFGVAITYGDVTARRRAEEALSASETRYRLLFNEMPMGFAVHEIICGPDGTPCDYRFIEINPAFERITGLERSAVLGRTLRELVPAVETFWVETYGRVALTGAPVHFEQHSAMFDKHFEVAAYCPQPGQFATIVADITQRKQAEASAQQMLSDLTESRAQLHGLSQQLLDTQENERREIARELHDEIGQALTAVKTNLETLLLGSDPGAMVDRLRDSSSIVDRALDSVRTLALDLRPSLLDHFGLVPALEWYLDRQGQRSGLAITLSVDPPEMSIPSPLETTCFRIVQSGLTNAIRHAGATRFQVSLCQRLTGGEGGQTSAELELKLRDDGQGFNVEAALEGARRGRSMGLLAMLERVHLVGGIISIDSKPGRGTQITASFPLL